MRKYNPNAMKFIDFWGVTMAGLLLKMKYVPCTAHLEGYTKEFPCI